MTIECKHCILTRAQGTKSETEHAEAGSVPKETHNAPRTGALDETSELLEAIEWKGIASEILVKEGENYGCKEALFTLG